MGVAAVFSLTYLGLAMGRVPGLRTDRAGIALAGAAALLAMGALTLPEAASVDAATIVLLFGMIVVAAYLRMSGFLEMATDRIASRFSGPRALLGVVVALSGTLSAFLVNDVVCVALTPLVLELAQRLGRRPLPYLVALAAASNVGSVATITGNPQNIIIGSLSGISYPRFFARLGPVAAIGLVLVYVTVALAYRSSLSAPPLDVSGRRRTPRPSRPLMVKSVAVILLAVAGFFAGFPIATVAMVAAAAMLLSRARPSRVYEAVDWPLLVMFAGLFVVVHGFEEHVVRPWGLENWEALRESPVVKLGLASAFLSNLVSNVPAVLLFRPLMAGMPDPELAWLSLAMTSTLAGNLTLLGSVANLIVAETARRSGVELGFREYLKVGVPLTILTTAFGMAWLAWARY